MGKSGETRKRGSEQRDMAFGETVTGKQDGTALEKAWRKFCQKYPEANFLQSPAWQRTNQLIGHKTVLEHDEDSWCLMIVKDAKRGRYLEVPGGPVLDWSADALVERTFEKVLAVARAEGCVFIRLRPQLSRSAEHEALLRAHGARPAPMHLHAEHTVIINLEQSEDELLKAMRKQTRYEVRRAAKLGITVDWNNSEELFREFHTMQAATAARQKFVPPSLEVLLAEREAFGNQARIYVARSAEGEAIAYGLILTDGVEAEYFEAASTELNRKLPGAYALLWQVMQDLKEQGIKRFNLWGIAPVKGCDAGKCKVGHEAKGQHCDARRKGHAALRSAKPHRYAGVTIFKTGFGGEVVEFVPAQDIVIRKGRYLIDLLVEKMRKKWRHL